mgnify:CR=1 FL=1
MRHGDQLSNDYNGISQIRNPALVMGHAPHYERHEQRGGEQVGAPHHGLIKRWSGLYDLPYPVLEVWRSSPVALQLGLMLYCLSPACDHGQFIIA